MTEREIQRMKQRKRENDTKTENVTNNERK